MEQPLEQPLDDKYSKLMVRIKEEHAKLVAKAKLADDQAIINSTTQKSRASNNVNIHTLVRQIDQDQDNLIKDSRNALEQAPTDQPLPQTVLDSIEKATSALLMTATLGHLIYTGYSFVTGTDVTMTAAAGLLLGPIGYMLKSSANQKIRIIGNMCATYSNVRPDMAKIMKNAYDSLVTKLTTSPPQEVIFAFQNVTSNYDSLVTKLPTTPLQEHPFALQNVTKPPFTNQFDEDFMKSVDMGAEFARNTNLNVAKEMAKLAEEQATIGYVTQAWNFISSIRVVPLGRTITFERVNTDTK